MAATLRFSILLPTSLVLAAGLFAAGFSAVGCSSSDSGDSQGDAGNGDDAGGNSQVDPCEDELTDECGAECSASDPCDEGLYCKSGECTADCTPNGGQCKTNEKCDEHGRCMIDDTNIPDPNMDKDGGGTCIEQDVQFESLTPTVELLIDRSQSMTADFGSNKDRWNTIRDILVDPDEGFIKRMEGKVRFGLALYTSEGTNGCPNLTEVDFALNNYDEIYDVFTGIETGDNTPTAESVKAVTAKLDAYKQIGPKVIVLATDGDPDTCDDPNSNGTEPPRQDSLEAVEAAWDKRITTYVISVGPEATQSHLEDLARAGRGGDENAMPYQALNANALEDAFNTILGGVVSCDFDLNGEVEPDDADQGSITVGGTPLVYEDPDGYEMPTTTSVRLLGDACEALKQSVLEGGDANVNIKFPCDIITIIR